MRLVSLERVEMVRQFEKKIKKMRKRIEKMRVLVDDLERTNAHLRTQVFKMPDDDDTESENEDQQTRMSSQSL